MPLFYVDASALVKVIANEQGTEDLATYVEGGGTRQQRGGATLIDSLGLRSADDVLLIGAGMLAEPALRSLDAIHVATAVHLYPIDAFVTYDKRQAAVARLAGLRTVAPGGYVGL